MNTLDTTPAAPARSPLAKLSALRRKLFLTRSEALAATAEATARVTAELQEPLKRATKALQDHLAEAIKFSNVPMPGLPEKVQIIGNVSIQTLAHAANHPDARMVLVQECARGVAAQIMDIISRMAEEGHVSKKIVHAPATVLKDLPTIVPARR